MHPDGRTILMSVWASRPTTAETRPYYHDGRDSTFAFDTEARQWTYIGEWLLPFSGRAYYDRELDALVGVYHYEEGPGRLCCCDVPPASRCEAMPSRRIGAELFFDAPSDHHVGATLVYMGDNRFYLLGCRAGEDKDDSDGRLRVVDGWSHGRPGKASERQICRSMRCTADLESHLDTPGGYNAPVSLAVLRSACMLSFRGPRGPHRLARPLAPRFGIVPAPPSGGEVRPRRRPRTRPRRRKWSSQAAPPTSFKAARASTS
jgi:hypothetical protein